MNVRWLPVCEMGLWTSVSRTALTATLPHSVGFLYGNADFVWTTSEFVGNATIPNFFMYFFLFFCAMQVTNLQKRELWMHFYFF